MYLIVIATLVVSIALMPEAQDEHWGPGRPYSPGDPHGGPGELYGPGGPHGGPGGPYGSGGPHGGPGGRYGPGGPHGGPGGPYSPNGPWDPLDPPGPRGGPYDPGGPYGGIPGLRMPMFGRRGPPPVFHMFEACKEFNTAMGEKEWELKKNGEIGRQNCEEDDFKKCMLKDLITVRCAVTQEPSAECRKEIDDFLKGSSNCDSEIETPDADASP